MRIKHNRRQGVSMLETVIYVSLSAVLVTLTAQWFHVVFQVASKNKLGQRQHASLKRLAEDFRTDVVSAAEVDLKGEQRQVTLTSALRGKIVYRIEDGWVKKFVGDPKKPAQQETYPDLDDLRIEFSQDEGGELGAVTMNIFRPSNQFKLEKKSNAQKEIAPKEKETALLQVRCAPIPSSLEEIK